MTSSSPKRPATSLAATRWPWWMGSNVPPITPIRPPVTERGYPVLAVAGPAGPVRPGGRPRVPRAADPSPTGSPVQPVAARPADRRDRTGAVGWTNGAALTNGHGGLRLRGEQKTGSDPPRACRRASSRRRAGSQGGDEVRELRRIAALDHVDDVAVLVGGGV